MGWVAALSLQLVPPVSQHQLAHAPCVWLLGFAAVLVLFRVSAQLLGQGWFLQGLCQHPQQPSQAPDQQHQGCLTHPLLLHRRHQHPPCLLPDWAHGSV
jgi:hypothetical protein